MSVWQWLAAHAPRCNSQPSALLACAAA